MPELHRLTATEAKRRIEAGTLRPVEFMEACLERIAAREPTIRAFAYFDPARAREAASIARPGPLHGLPVGIKDILDTADMPTGNGSPIWAGSRPKADAAAVAWMRAAGGVAIGKTVTTEFATRKPGPTRNPHNLAHTPGGSSSGSAAGVADGFFPLAFGSQTAGSVVRPAAFCGVVGYKPTFGMISRVGAKVMSDSLDTVGVLARSVADCALLAAAVSGRELGDPDRKPGRAPEIGLCRTPVWDHAEPETATLLAEVGEILARAGAHISERDLPSDFALVEHAHPVVMNTESARALGWELATAREQISDQLLERLDFGLAQTDAAIAEAYAVFTRAQAAFPSVMDGLDILLTPSAPGVAPEGIGWTGDPVFNFIWTSLHVPCVTVPAGTGRHGLPLGIQIVARRGEDRAALAWAQWVAAALG
ncbi:MAG: amidase [Alphaproteobacteria bacterium]|nr:amidase [Alphaproteobacteria bacterium]